ncbi:TPA: hypothetical protein ACFIW2_001989 [Neisseria gonorrhoeae]|uniref:hypothetical protein n=1 Tax=Neisseria meningitidis TaxID=487 RepID=UPI000B27848C|nr:hypothetical protein [Neisseria meningitidis]
MVYSPYCPNNRADFPAGQIVLKHGEHKKVNHGFGVIHILAEHKADLTRFGLSHDETGVTLLCGNDFFNQAQKFLVNLVM